MAIWYVDPVNGNNANAGTSFAAAWRWLPGNGSAINPGDEVRFAKSAERTPTASQRSVNQSGETVTNSPASYQTVALGATWTVGSGGGSVSGSTLTFTAGTNVPANTKLMYVAVTRSQTTLNGYEYCLRLKNIPASASGGNLKVVLCSDAAGATIIRTLNGPTWLNTDGNGCTCSFTFSQAGTLNDSIGSVAVYSVSAFTTDAGGSATISTDDIAGGRNLLVTPDQALSTTHYLRRGDVFDWTSPHPIATGVLNSRKDTYLANGVSAALFRYLPTARRISTSSYSLFSNIATVYSAIPYQAVTVWEAALTYNGSSGSRIRFRGGFDTTSNTQTGYTNLGIQNLSEAARLGWFCFSSGGTYIDFERFISLQCSLVAFTYTLTAITGHRFYDCVLGTGASGHQPAIYTATTITAPVAIDAFYAERCQLEEWFTFARARAHSAGSPTTLYDPTNFTFGSITIIDGTISNWGGKFGGNIVCSGDITFQSSVADTTTLYLTSSGGGSMRPSSTFSGTFTIKDAVYAVSSITLSMNGGAVANSAKFLLRNVSFTDNQFQSAAQGIFLTIGDYRDVTLDGFGFHNSTNGGNRPITGIFVTNTAGFYAANGSAFIKIGGPVYSSQTTTTVANHNHDGVEISNPPTTLDFTSPAPPRSMTLATGGAVPGAASLPGLVLSQWSGNPFTVQNFAGSYIHFKQCTYTAGTYYPSHPEAVVQNCPNAKVSSENHIGVVRAYGGAYSFAAPYRLSYYSMSHLAPGMLVYGASIENIYDQNVAVAGSVNAEKRAIGVGLTGTDIQYGFYQSNTLINGYKSLMLEAGSTMAAAGTNPTTYSDWRGSQMRQPNGGFWVRRGGKTYKSDVVQNAFGKREVTLDAKTGMPLARLDVLAGTTIQCNLRIRCVPAVTNQGFFRFSVTIPPTTAYATDIAAHYFRKNFINNTDDFLMSFNIAPTANGEVFINLYTWVQAILKDFSAAVV